MATVYSKHDHGSGLLAEVEEAGMLEASSGCVTPA